jgi:hypothetical protein
VNGQKYTQESGGWVPFVRTSAYQIAHLIDEDINATLCGRYRDRIHLRMDTTAHTGIRQCLNCKAERERRQRT